MRHHGSVASLFEDKGNDKIVANGSKKEFASTITPGGSDNNSGSSNTSSGNTNNNNNNNNSSDTKSEKTIVATIDIPKGTIVTEKMLTNKQEAVTDTNNITSTYRLVEYTMIMLPTELEKGDTIDIRMSYPNGQDFIVASKKVVEKTDSISIWMKLREDEILKMNSAVVESYSAEGAKLYAVNYTQPGIQAPANPNYPVSARVYELLMSDPNIATAIQNEYRNKINTYTATRGSINEIIKATDDELKSRISSGVQKEIKERAEKRQAFIEGAKK